MKGCSNFKTSYIACLFFILTGISLGILIIMCLEYAHPHLTLMSYLHTNCTIASSVYTMTYFCDATMNCVTSCASRYPCLLIHTTVLLENGQWSKMIPVFASDTQKKYASDTDQRCSFSICSIDASDNMLKVIEFRKRQGQTGSVQTCYYDPGDITGGAIFERTTNWVPVFHATVWPSIITAINAIVCIITCHRAWTKSTCVSLRSTFNRSRSSSYACTSTIPPIQVATVSGPGVLPDFLRQQRRLQNKPTVTI
ncbi:unnamed protein product [Owenia fusiformis]|uniref:Uncharacterized protein n=1 Tax=Owenia fusiformis TaxID=6347 RepID=A0A8J1TH79_OWEFU|nr:unnamed protein product [Owenia fusiformis]